MDGRKWENLQRDCLVKVFEKVGTNGLLREIPLVCKSWNKASLDPHCWKYINAACYTAFPSPKLSKGLKFLADCSRGTAIHFEFPYACCVEDLTYVTEKCPALESVYLPGFCIFDCSCSNPPVIGTCDCEKNNPDVFSSLVAKWKDLKFLTLTNNIYFEETVSQVGIHCKKLEGVTIGATFGDKEALAVITHLPKIKYLKTDLLSYMTRENLIAVLGGCKELVEVEAGGCVGFEADDEEILKMSSHIKHFKVEGFPHDMFVWSEANDEVIVGLQEVE